MQDMVRFRVRIRVRVRVGDRVSSEIQRIGQKPDENKLWRV